LWLCNELLEVAFAEKLKISNFKVVTLIFAGKSREKRSFWCT
jgi:predicted RNA-binding Zn ribbon-like protein